MEGPGPTSNAGALHKSGLRFTKSHMIEQFRLNFSPRFCVDSLVEALWRGLERDYHHIQGDAGKGQPAAAVQGRRADRSR
eukprot:3099396-Pleurochrysis_carterae.AAC.1